MKPNTIFLTLFATLFCCCCSAQSSWYRSYNASIDKYPIVMHVHKAGVTYSGYYYYASKQQPVYFSGNDTTVKGKVKVFSYLPDGETTETFVFTIADSTMTGEWFASETAKALKFSATEKHSSFAFDYIYVEGTQPLRAKKKDSPAADYFSATIWPKGNSAQDVFLKKAISEAYRKNPSQEIGKIMLDEKKAFFKGYLEDYKDVKDSDIQADDPAYNSSENDQVFVVYQTAKLLVIADETYSYTGGAHGNYGTIYSSFDMVSNKKLALKDIVNAAGKEKLSALLEKHFKKDRKMAPTDSLNEMLFENSIAPNDNFYVTAKGIGFCYNPYDIAAYAIGEINIFIPFTELNAYLQPGFKKLIL